MDATAVNWAVLDAMVIDYCTAEELIVRFPEQEQRHGARGAIKQIRSLIERGSIAEAVALIKEHASLLLQDQRFVFWLYKQQFIEMLRGGGNDARLQAIECSRTQLSPCALNAYPEAYEEFKRVLLALIYDNDHQNSPVAEEWCEARRKNLAAIVASTLKAYLHVEDSLFSLTLCYLISVHNAYCIRRNVASPVGSIANEILLKDRDPPPALQDSFAEVPSFNEVDVQALAQAAELPRQDAIRSLRYTRGDVMAALKNELGRIRMNTAIVDKLVWEYCVYRGLIESATVDDISLVKGSEGSDGRVDADTSRISCYRWRGRVSAEAFVAGELLTADVDMEPAQKPATYAAIEKYRRSVQIRQLITQKRIKEAINEVRDLDPGFFEKHPQLLFQLKQIAFCSFVEAGDHARALQIARVDLGPLAAKYPELLKPLKETVLSLACDPRDTSMDHISAAGLAASAQISLSTSLGISEPQLMKLLKSCLFAHTEWFKVQMCSDPFADLLKINALKEKEGGISKVVTKKMDASIAGQHPGTSTSQEGEGPPFEESSILTLMEWMALPRADAIQLLVEYDGSVEEVFAQLMG